MKKSQLYCKAVSFRGLSKFIRELGANPDALFSEAGLDIAHAFKGNHYYDWNKACNLLELSAQRLGEPYLGLKWAHRVSMDGLNSGPTLLMGAISANIKDFFELAGDYQKIHVNGVSYVYEIDEGLRNMSCEVRIHPLSAPCRQLMEHIMAFCVLLERRYVKAANFTKITFQHSAPEDLHWYKKTFQCEVEFDAPKNTAITYADYLNVPLAGKLTTIQPFVRMCLNRQINKQDHFQLSISETVEHILPTVLGMSKSGLKDIADILEMNPKKLQRLLADEGNTYSEIVDKVSKSMAKRFLYESDVAISHIASILDYSSSEAFNTACKRWFGMSPSDYRRKLRADGAEKPSLSNFSV